MMLRFPFTRTRKGILWRTRWFLLRVYPPVLPRFTFWMR